MKQRKLGSTDLDAEVGQQAAALGQGEVQVMVAAIMIVGAVAKLGFIADLI